MPKCPLFNNPKVLCRIKPGVRPNWTDGDKTFHFYNYCESDYYFDCQDFGDYIEQEAIAKGKILVVDDEQALLNTLSSFFSSRGYKMMTATSAEAALELLKTEQPALAMVDIKLPGINGLELVKILKRDYPDTKVFVVTGFDEEHKQAAEALGVDAYLPKPIALEQLKAHVARVLSPTERRIQFALEATRPTEGIAQAKLLFVLEELPDNDRFIKVLRDWFENQTLCEGDYQMEFTFSIDQTLEKLMTFRPDIVLINFDSLYKISCAALCTQILKSPYRPKELIVFGLSIAALDKQRVEEVGARYVDQRRSFLNLLRTVKHAALRLRSPTNSAPRSTP